MEGDENRKARVLTDDSEDGGRRTRERGTTCKEMRRRAMGKRRERKKGKDGEKEGVCE